MRRKIIKQGAATLTISLPAKWTKRFSLKGGDEVEVIEHERDLLVSSGKPGEKKREVLDLTRTDRMLKRLVAAKYLKGADEIEVKVNNVKKARIIQQRVREMIGMEVVQQGKNFLVIKDIAGAAEGSFDPVLRRVFFMLNAVAEESIKALRQKETDLAYLEDMESNINRFTDYCIRLLNKQGYPEVSKTPMMFSLVTLLEELADGHKRFLQAVTREKTLVPQELVAVYSQIQQLLRQVEQCVFAFSYEKVISASVLRDAIIANLEKRTVQCKSAKEMRILYLLRSITDLTMRLLDPVLILA